VELAGFATSLKGRTSSQRHNAILSAKALDGQMVAPGAVFSFNSTVKAWSSDGGYVKAPVSYDGELIRAYGGGVCQTSTTLYDAALLAGLQIVERHSHVFVAHYAQPGRDAAVAQPKIDLRFRNPYPWPIRIRAGIAGDALSVKIIGKEKPRQTVTLTSEVLSASVPERLTRVVERSGSSTGKVYVRAPGAQGCRVVTYRVFYDSGKEVRRERLSDDTYQAMNRVVQLTEVSE
jgi:vancomycin resistance protein YoaR